jgi:hypothetical protein
MVSVFEGKSRPKESDDGVGGGGHGGGGVAWRGVAWRGVA